MLSNRFYELFIIAIERNLSKYVLNKEDILK